MATNLFKQAALANYPARGLSLVRETNNRTDAWRNIVLGNLREPLV